MSYSASVRSDHNASAPPADAPITTVIFGVDSTLYAASLGIERLRREQVLQFMIEELGFSRRWAEPILHEFLPKYKNELKALQMAEQQNYFPEGVVWLSDSGLSWLAGSSPYTELSQFLEDNVDLSSLMPASEKLRAFLGACMQRDTHRGVEGALKLIAFSGAPRGFIFKALDKLQLTPYFHDIGRHDYLTARRIFGAENVLPHYKPQARAEREPFARESPSERPKRDASDAPGPMCPPS